MAIHFKDGKKVDGGKQYDATAVLITYSSNGITIYTATRWSDDTASCNCQGWATSKKDPKSCKHSRRVATMHGVVNETGAPAANTVGRLAAAQPAKSDAPNSRAFDYCPDLVEADDA